MRSILLSSIILAVPWERVSSAKSPAQKPRIGRSSLGCVTNFDLRARHRNAIDGGTTVYDTLTERFLWRTSTRSLTSAGVSGSGLVEALRLHRRQAERQVTRKEKESPR